MSPMVVLVEDDDDEEEEDGAAAGCVPLCCGRGGGEEVGWGRGQRELGAEDGFQTGVGPATMGRGERGATRGAGGGSAYLREYKGPVYMYISNLDSRG